LPNT